jgi:hypothetical protein
MLLCDRQYPDLKLQHAARALRVSGAMEQQ